MIILIAKELGLKIIIKKFSVKELRKTFLRFGSEPFEQYSIKYDLKVVTRQF